MTDMEEQTKISSGERPEGDVFYKIRFRSKGQEFTASSPMADLLAGEPVMAKTDHGLEPATIIQKAPSCGGCGVKRGASFTVARRLTEEERERYDNLSVDEHKGFTVCTELIAKHSLDMSLVRVEKFFNGSKIIFYFTADNRVDFRELVKDLVQEFRTRVEMRQVGVRHETKMLGGLGTCGRELCCSSYMKKFDSVSIKMAKEQDLPLNPAKISGVCNRLLCCLTYEFPTYHEQRRKMPKVGSWITLDGVEYKVKQQRPLQQQLVVVTANNEERVLGEKKWQSLQRGKNKKPKSEKH